MSSAKEFRLGADVRETVKHICNAMLLDYIESDDLPSEDELILRIEKYVAKLPPLHSRGWSLMVRAMEMSPLAMGYKRKFGNLTREEQVEVIIKYEQSQNYVQRATVMGLKSLLVMILAAQPEIETLMGYDGRCLLDAK